MTTLQTILFDFDGTLAPNLDLPDMRRQVTDLTIAQQVPAQVYANHYIVEVIDAAWAWLKTNRSQHAADAYFEAAHLLITDIEMAASAHTDPLPGIPEKLIELRHLGLCLGVVTRNCRAAVVNVFPDILCHIDALHTRDDVEFLKPDTRHLLSCLDALNTPPSQAAMVGDGGLDMQAGRELSMHCVGVLTGSTSEAALLRAGAHIVLPSCLEIEQILQ